MRLVAIVSCLVVCCLVSGCGNRTEVCTDTRRTLEGFAAKIQTLPSADAVQWKRAITDVADRLDRLSGKADDRNLKRALGGIAASYRSAAAGMDKGDTSRLTAVIRDQPQRLDQACR